MNYYTSDLHFNHKLMLEKRPFETLEEHDTTIIDNINNTCLAGDVLYVLGDFAFVNRVEDVDFFVKRIKPQVHMIWGNHDHRRIRKYPFAWSGYYKEVKGTVLFHYPIQSWNRTHYGSMHLHGHAHGSLPQENIRRMDVGVDTNNFFPYSEEEITTILEPRPFGAHH